MKYVKYLTVKELKNVKGGISISNQGEILNVNRTFSCICNYLNDNTVINDNKTDGCACLCRLRPSKQKNNMRTLNKNELKTLLGGICIQKQNDTVNLNKIKDCICYFNNSSATLTNDNRSDGCGCTCRVINKTSIEISN